MRSKQILLTVMALAVVGLFSASASAQEQAFSDPNVEYSFTVPGGKWKMTVKPSPSTPNVEYVYGDRRDGHFEIRKVSIGKDAPLSDVIQDDEEKRQFLPGYVAGKEEPFSGKFRGSVFNFEYVQGGKPMSGRFYFLRVNPTTVYMLRFTGQTSILRSVRNETDMIARTFSVKG